MSKLEYIGKCLLIKEEKERILVIGDMHLGAGGGEIGGIDLGGRIFEEMMKEIDEIFDKAGNVSKIVLLGDLKHNFSGLTEDERNDLSKLFNYLEKKSKEVIVIRGNHDNYLLSLTEKRGLKVLDYYVWKEFCFLHGDRDFKEIWDGKIRYWVMGHLHPAVVLREEGKAEKYKCFLEGEFKGKKIIIMPSFAGFNEGVDVGRSENEGNLAWELDLEKFNVKIVDEEDKLKVIDFGELKNLRE